MTPSPTTQIEPVAAAYRTGVEAGSLRGPVTPAPGRSPLFEMATKIADAIGRDWSMPEITARCRATVGGMED